MGFFTNATFSFLADLAENNNKPWFQDNKARYEADVKAPCLAFIHALAPRMQALSPEIQVNERSMFRIYRDVRFSKDKSPYKTSVGLQFRHIGSGDVHGPGFYLHIDPTGCFFGAGAWEPEPAVLARLRGRVLADPQGWSDVAAAIDAAGMTWSGEALKRPPAGVAADHPHVEQLKRKSWIVIDPVARSELTSDGAVDAMMRRCDASAPLMEDISRALGLAW